MPTALPIETFTTKTAKVDPASAANINTLQTSIVTIETALNLLVNTDGSIRQGTSFPVSPVPGQLFFRTDLNTVYIRNAANSAWVINAAVSNIQIFESNGTFTAPTGITKVYLSMVGGGGGGAGAHGNPDSHASGGGGGEGIHNLAYTVTPGNNYAVTVPAAAAGGVGAANGANGGDVVFNSDITVSGGSGGINGTTPAGGAGGSANSMVGGNNGGTPGTFYSFSGGQGGGNTSGFSGGSGGGSILGIGGQGGAAKTNGSAPTFGYGGGGGGAGMYDGGSSTDTTGGAGAKGVCIVMY